MSEESTQVFRGSEAPEITFTESRAAARPKPAVAPPADQRAMSDAKDGPSDTRSLPEADAGGAAEQRRIDDASGGVEAELRQLQDTTAPLPDSGTQATAAPHAAEAATTAGTGQGPAQVREWQDTSVTAPPELVKEDSTGSLPSAEARADSTVTLPATAISDSTTMLPVADAPGDRPGGPVESRQLLDTSAPLPVSGFPPAQDGVAPPAEGSEGRSGPSDSRHLRDTVAAKPGANFQPDDEPLPPATMRDEQSSGAAAPAPAQVGAVRADEPPVPAAGPAAGGISDPDLTFKPHDATPWALSIHLQERIASLGVSTARVGNQLDALEESIKRLGKRIKK